MNEPGNHTAWVDRLGDTWVRVDEFPRPGQYDRRWWRNGTGKPRRWDLASLYGPFKRADAERTAQALARVRQEWSR